MHRQAQFAPRLEVVEAFDPRELDTRSRLSERVPADMQMHRYQLVEKELLRAAPFSAPITRISTLRLPDAHLCYIEDRFATQIDICGDGLDSYCLSVPMSGTMLLNRGRAATLAGGSRGLVLRGSVGTQLLTSDGATRLNLWIKAGILVDVLQEILGGRVFVRPEFRPDVDWSTGLAAGLQAQIGFLFSQMTLPAGQREATLSLPSFTRMLASNVLHGLPHDYSERMSGALSCAVPSYVRRAEAFMHAHATSAIHLADVARAAGCSSRALSQAFRRFRDTTPLAALHAIRLDLVRTMLQRRDAAPMIGTIAREHGFTSLSRFRAAYVKRFGELPSETARAAF